MTGGIPLSMNSLYYRLFARRISLIIMFYLFFYNTSRSQELPDTLVSQRIQFIQQMLDQGKPGANRWWYGWLFGYSAATVIQGALFFTSHNNKTRQDMAVGAATTLLGVGGQLITPMVPGYAPDRLRNIPVNSIEESRNKLATAEDLFFKSYLREKTGRSWQTHAIAGVVNMGAGLVVWLGFKRSFLEGLENFAINTVVTESQIWSQPVRAIKDYKYYCSQYDIDKKLSQRKLNLSWYVGLYPGGARVEVLF